ncbi:MAG TPA: hypothetical protein VGF10_14200 [Gaiella sp.]|jgi:hypothetical protein
MKLAASLTLALVSAIALLYAGIWLGSRERTCAAVPSNFGKVVVCSSDYAQQIRQ